MATSVLDWLEATAARVGDKVALSDARSSLTYAQLSERSRQAGSWIARHSDPRRAIALFLEKSPEAFAAMLGAAQAGCYYAVIDVRQSEQRAHAMIATLNPAAILVDEASAEAAHELFGDLDIPLALLDEALDAEPDQALLASRRAGAADIDPLYVTFTSGSTGTPKGVVTSHRSVIDFVSAFVGCFSICESDVMGNQAPFDFDASVKDLYSALLTGATVRLIPRDLFTRPTELMDYVADGGATVLVWAVSAMCFVSIMNGFDYRIPESVRIVLFSGEVMPPKQLAVWRRALPDATYVNLYGPTESTCNCSYFIVDRDYAPDEVIPAGKAFPNERIVLLDEQDREVREPNVDGEVCVSGSTLALGYLANPEQTAKAFVRNPLSPDWPETIYRTGDLAHYDANGDLIYVSRKDNQIKHLGQRIELGEIEATAQAMDGIQRAVCLYDARRKRLHLVYVGSLEKDDFAARLKEALPSYMVPNRVRQVDAMPLNKNGKTDRGALEQLCRIRR